jgi:hypothetical protein
MSTIEATWINLLPLQEPKSSRALSPSLVVQFMKENGETNSERVSADKNGPMAVDTRVTGLTIKPMVSENCFMLTAMYTKASGKTTKRMGKELILMLMELAIREIGEMISSMDSVLRHGLMEQFTKVNTLRAKRMARASLLLLTVLSTMETSK